jgi:hypothetical protein
MTDGHATPGVYEERQFPTPAPELATGVAGFIGCAERGPVGIPEPLTLWSQFGVKFGAPLSTGYLAHAVRGFFQNGGRRCYVVRVDEAAGAEEGLRSALEAMASSDAIDLVAAPDLMRPREQGALPPDLAAVGRMQAALLRHCDDLNDRFSILDAWPDAGPGEVLAQRAGLTGTNGALYYPWIQVPGALAPPSGHVAGLYARTDQRVGVHKAPANDMLEGVLDLQVNLTDLQQAALNPEGVNCLRAFPGRGIRVWGARTLALDPAWRYVTARRLLLTAGRWIESNMAAATFEPSDPQLWSRIARELTGYLNGLFRQGALDGRTARDAFFVKCDAETNTPDVRAAGMVVAEVGVAPAAPSEFVVIRIVHGPTGVTVAP